MRKILLLIIVCVGEILFCSAQNAAPASDTSIGKKSMKILKAPWFVEKFRVSAGFFLPINNTDVRVSNNTGSIGTDIDFENDLGFERTTGTFLGDAQWRISRRSRLDFSYYRLHRSTTHTLKKDIIFGDHTYNINSTVDAFFNNDIYRISYGYAILEKPRYEFGVLIGAHIVHTDAGLGVHGASANLDLHNDFGFTAPLPDLGLWGGYSFSERLAITAEFDYFSLAVGDINGRILASNVQVIYRVVKTFDLALGYTGFNFRVDATKPKVNGTFKWGYNGPSLVASFTFGKKSWTH